MRVSSYGRPKAPVRKESGEKNLGVDILVIQKYLGGWTVGLLENEVIVYQPLAYLNMVMGYGTAARN